jgi:hypothetical protein
MDVSSRRCPFTNKPTEESTPERTHFSLKPRSLTTASHHPSCHKPRDTHALRSATQSGGPANNRASRRRHMESKWTAAVIPVFYNTATAGNSAQALPPGQARASASASSLPLAGWLAGWLACLALIEPGKPTWSEARDRRGGTRVVWRPVPRGTCPILSCNARVLEMRMAAALHFSSSG